MKKFGVLSKLYNAEHHVFALAEELQKLNQDQLKEFAEASPLYKELLQIARKFVKAEAEEFGYYVSEVAPFDTLEFSNEEVKGIIEIQKEQKRQAKKPIFEEIRNSIGIPKKVVNYEQVYQLPVVIDTVVEHIDADGDCVLIPVESFDELRNALTETNYLFYQSKNSKTNKMEVWVWKA